jgi:hypothetical protein
MNDKKYTPGPWVLREDGFIVDCDDCIIADPHCKPGPEIEEREANARLIAAAPELLQACKEIIEAEEFMVASFARAAIAKAEKQNDK